MTLLAEATTLAVISQGSGKAQATAQSEIQWLGLETELGCRLSGHGFAGSWATQGTAAAELDSGRGCTGSFRAWLGGGEYEVACWPTPSPVFISV